jgi:hypothetical protein
MGEIIRNRNVMSACRQVERCGPPKIAIAPQYHNLHRPTRVL